MVHNNIKNNTKTKSPKCIENKSKEKKISKTKTSKKTNKKKLRNKTKERQKKP